MTPPRRKQAVDEEKKGGHLLFPFAQTTRPKVASPGNRLGKKCARSALDRLQKKKPRTNRHYAAVKFGISVMWMP
jgi:hypothetical protein